MSNILGTNVAAPIVPFTTNDGYPTHYANYGAGGHQTVDTFTSIANIPAARLAIGMTATCQDTGFTYSLTSAGWIQKATTATDFTVVDDLHIPTVKAIKTYVGDTAFLPGGRTDIVSAINYINSQSAASVTYSTAFSTNGNNIAPIFGTTAGTFAQGNDSRFNSLSSKVYFSTAPALPQYGDIFIDPSNPQQMVTSQLTISGPQTFLFNAAGTSYNPSLSAYSYTLAVGTGSTATTITSAMGSATQTWSILSPSTSMLSCTNNAITTATFTPNMATTFNSSLANNTILLTVVYNGISYLASLPITITQVGQNGTSGTNGTNGSTPQLFINSGSTTYIYNALGTSPTPSVTAYSYILIINGTTITSGITGQSWSIANPSLSMLSGSSTSATFTPTLTTNFSQSLGNNAINLSVIYGGNIYTTSLPISITMMGATGATGAPGLAGPIGPAGASGGFSRNTTILFSDFISGYNDANYLSPFYPVQTTAPYWYANTALQNNNNVGVISLTTTTAATSSTIVNAGNAIISEMGALSPAPTSSPLNPNGTTVTYETCVYFPNISTSESYQFGFTDGTVFAPSSYASVLYFANQPFAGNGTTVPAATGGNGFRGYSGCNIESITVNYQNYNYQRQAQNQIQTAKIFYANPNTWYVFQIVGSMSYAPTNSGSGYTPTSTATYTNVPLNCYSGTLPSIMPTATINVTNGYISSWIPFCTPTNGGTGYANGGTATYTNVPLTLSGSATSILATFVVISGVVISIGISANIASLVASSTYSVTAVNIGSNGNGSGFSYTYTTATLGDSGTDFMVEPRYLGGSGGGMQSGTNGVYFRWGWTNTGCCFYPNVPYTYTNVPLIVNGTSTIPSSYPAANITICNGTVIRLTIASNSSLLVNGTTYTCPSAYIGGTGSGFTWYYTSLTFSTTTGVTAGSNYTSGTYTNVPLTLNGITTTPILYATIVVANGSVSTVTLTNTPKSLVIGNTYSCNNSYLGGTGSGFSWTYQPTAYVPTNPGKFYGMMSAAPTASSFTASNNTVTYNNVTLTATGTSTVSLTASITVYNGIVTMISNVVGTPIAGTTYTCTATSITSWTNSAYYSGTPGTGFSWTYNPNLLGYVSTAILTTETFSVYDTNNNLIWSDVISAETVGFDTLISPYIPTSSIDYPTTSEYHPSVYKSNYIAQTLILSSGTAPTTYPICTVTALNNAIAYLTITNPLVGGDSTTILKATDANLGNGSGFVYKPYLNTSPLFTGGGVYTANATWSGTLVLLNGTAPTTYPVVSITVNAYGTITVCTTTTAMVGGDYTSVFGLPASSVATVGNGIGFTYWPLFTGILFGGSENYSNGLNYGPYYLPQEPSATTVYSTVENGINIQVCSNTAFSLATPFPPASNSVNTIIYSNVTLSYAAGTVPSTYPIATIIVTNGIITCCYITTNGIGADSTTTYTCTNPVLGGITAGFTYRPNYLVPTFTPGSGYTNGTAVSYTLILLSGTAPTTYPVVNVTIVGGQVTVVSTPTTASVGDDYSTVYTLPSTAGSGTGFTYKNYTTTMLSAGSSYQGGVSSRVRINTGGYSNAGQVGYQFLAVDYVLAEVNTLLR